MWEVTEDIVKRKLKMHKQNAKKRGIKCTLTEKQLFHLLTINSGICDYTSTPMSLYSETLDVRISDQVSLERISEYGVYELNNILLVRSDINYLKSLAIETKHNWNPESVTIELKEKLNSIYKVIFNPIKLQEVQSKYLTYKETPMNIKQDKTPAEVPPQALKQEFVSNPDIALAKAYNALGEVVESISRFELTFAEYKAKINKRGCSLTGVKFKEEDKKCLWWVDKKLPFSKANTLVTTELMSNSLDTLMASCKMDIKQLKKLAKVINNL